MSDENIDDASGHILRFDAVKTPAETPVHNATLPVISADVHAQLEFCLEAKQLLDDFCAFKKTYDPEGKEVADINRAITLFDEFAKYCKKLVGYVRGETYASTRGSPKFQAMSLTELSDVLDDEGGLWKKKPQFFHAISMIMQVKFEEIAQVEQGMNNAPLRELVPLLDVDQDEWKKNYRRYYLIAFLVQDTIKKYAAKLHRQK